MRGSWTASWLTLIAVTLCAATLAGCSSWPRSGIDPSGEHVFTPPPCPPSTGAVPPSTVAAPPSDLRYFDDPLNRLPWDDVAVQIEPRETVVPVGSEVILVAGVVGQDGYYRTNRRLEWTLAPGGVGHFVTVQKNGFCDLLLGDFNSPRIVNSTFAVGSTSRDNVRLNRGTPSTEDDRLVLRGQGWVSLTSPVEGTAYVNVVAPEVYGWDARTRSAAIHFVDAVVLYPPPAINPAGSKHTFTTTVTHFSTQTPCENWRVRYEIVGGPPAGFLPTMAPSVEVPTNSAGQACVDIVQKQPVSGVNKICIQVVRPAGVPGTGGPRLVVGSGTTTKTWSAADLAVRVAGPSVASVGTTIGYRIELANPGDLAAKDVVAIVDLPAGLTFQGANPQAELVGKQLRWRLGDLGPRQRRPIDLTFRADKPATVALCCDAIAFGGLKVRDCVTTTIGAAASPPPTSAPPASPGTPPGTPSAPIELQVIPAESTAAVGDKVTLKIGITNRTQSQIDNLRIRVSLDRGLASEATDENNRTDRKLSFLAAGETRRFDLPIDVKQPGRLSAMFEVVATGVAPVKSQVWINAAAGAAAPPATSQAIPLAVTVAGPQSPLAVGKLADFVIVVKNIGNAAVENVTVVDRCDQALDPKEATDGWRMDKDVLIWDVKKIAPGDSTELKVRCRCDSEAAKAYSRAIAMLPDGRKADGEAFVQIVKASETSPLLNSPPNGVTPPTLSADDGLSLTVVGLASPIPPGKELTYEIRVANVTPTTTYRQITVTAAVPPGMTPIPLGTTPVAKIDGQVIRFEPIAELAPGKSLTYRARVQANKLGNYRFHADLTATGLAKPKSFDADKTEVIE
jgi:uncharacterized repeat protein (TIGR01451 family)